MNILINLLIFCIILFVYIHVYSNIKTSNYLEIYEIDNPSKEKFEELCELKQPIIINNYNILDDNIDIQFLNNNFGSFDVKIRSKNNNDLFIPIKFSKFIELLNADNSGNYITELNEDFLEETTFIKTLQIYDIFLRPYNVSNKEYDIILGSTNSYTNLKYNIDVRNIIYVTSGEIEVILCPPNNKKFLHVNKNYESLEYYSDIDIYNVDDKFKNDYNKVKFLKVKLSKGSFLNIPAYWFYSIKILDKKTIIFSNKYRTYMNNIAIIPDLFLQFLQKNNQKFNLTKIADNIKSDI